MPEAGKGPRLDWVLVKEAVEAWTGLERDALHVYAAVGVQLVVAMLSRRSLSHPFPWLCALATVLARAQGCAA